MKQIFKNTLPQEAAELLTELKRQKTKELKNNLNILKQLSLSEPHLRQPSLSFGLPSNKLYAALNNSLNER